MSAVLFGVGQSVLVLPLLWFVLRARRPGVEWWPGPVSAPWQVVWFIGLFLVIWAGGLFRREAGYGWLIVAMAPGAAALLVAHLEHRRARRRDGAVARPSR